MSRLILASGSPYKHQLLERLRLPFEVRNSNADESAMPDEDAATLAKRLATAKAFAAVDTDAGPKEIVIGTDQVASLDGNVLRKPGDHGTALRQLGECQGKTVIFSTAVTVIDAGSGRTTHGFDRTEVDFLDLPRAALDRYLEREQPYDCAGGFKAEGLGISLFRRIRSDDPTALIGLPLIWLCQALRDLGLDPLDSSRN